MLAAVKDKARAGPTALLDLRSTRSAAGCPALFAGFFANMAGSDFSRPCIIGFGSAGTIEPGRHLARACGAHLCGIGQWNRGSGFPTRGAVIASLVDGFRLGVKIFGPLAELFSNVVPDRDAL